MKQLIEYPKIRGEKKGGCCCISMIIDLLFKCLVLWKNHDVDEKGVLEFALR